MDGTGSGFRPMVRLGTVTFVFITPDLTIGASDPSASVQSGKV
jgi:hypothetical protein